MVRSMSAPMAGLCRSFFCVVATETLEGVDGGTKLRKHKKCKCCEERPWLVRRWTPSPISVGSVLNPIIAVSPVRVVGTLHQHESTKKEKSTADSSILSLARLQRSLDMGDRALLAGSVCGGALRSGAKGLGHSQERRLPARLPPGDRQLPGSSRSGSDSHRPPQHDQLCAPTRGVGCV